jgi:hypothetical protein
MFKREDNLVQSLRKEIEELNSRIDYLEEQSFVDRSEAYENGWNDAIDEKE